MCCRQAVLLALLLVALYAATEARYLPTRSQDDRLDRLRELLRDVSNTCYRLSVTVTILSLRAQKIHLTAWRSKGHHTVACSGCVQTLARERMSGKYLCRCFAPCTFRRALPLSAWLYCTVQSTAVWLNYAFNSLYLFLVYIYLNYMHILSTA